MKKLLSLFVLLVAIVTGASADTEWVMKDWSTGHAGMTYWASGASSDIPSTSTDKNVPAWADESTYDTYTGTGGSSNFQLDSKTSTWKSGHPNRVWSFDVNADDAIKVYFCGGGTGSRSMYLSYNASTTNRDTNTAFASATADGYTPTILTGTATTAGTVYLWCDQNVRVYAIKVASGATTAPTITTDLPATANVTVGVAEGFSIVATGATSYQWYNGENAIEGATSATYSYTATAAGTVNLKCVATNSIGSTSSTVCAVTATAPANPPVITTDLSAAYNVNKGSTLELSIVAEDASSYQWYVDGAAVVGATKDTYTFTAGSTIGATNAVYCAAINAAGATNSATATITTVGRADCELTNIQFSNGAYGAINSATYGDGTIAVPYMAGTEAPTVEEASINISDGATYVLSGNTLTVTAEDETTSKVFTITTVEMTPLTVTADVTENFTEVPSWVFNLYGYDSTKGLKFAKAVNDATMRIALGNTRQYYFIGAAKSLTLTKTGTTRKVNVYVNGTKVISDTNNDALGAITLNETAPNLVIVEAAAGTNGDGGFSAYAIEAAAATTEAIEIPTDGVLTYVTQNALDFSSQNGAFKAYVPTGVNAKKTYVITEEVTAVPAGTALLLKGAAGIYNVNIVASAEEPEANIFQVSNGSVTGGDNIFAYSKTNKKFQKVANTVAIPSGKCYLVIEGVGQNALDIAFEGEATAVEAIAEANEADAAAPVKVIKNGKLYIGNFNVAGQQVK